MQVAKVVKIQLKDGSELSIDVSDKLLDAVATAFELSPESVGDNHVKYYLASSMKRAVEAYEGSGQ